MNRKYQCLLAVFLLFLFLPFFSYACASGKTQVIPLQTENTHALLLKYGEENVVIGGSDSQKIIDELKALDVNSISGIIAPCTHSEHAGAMETIHQQYQAAMLSTENLPQMENIQFKWLDQGVLIEMNGNRFAFGVEEAPENSIAYQCDGTLIPFNASTNETAVNVRAEASTKADRVAKLQRGDLITVTSAVQNATHEVWYQVALADGTKGYIRHDLVQYTSKTVEEIAAEQAAEETAKKENRYIGNKKSKVFHRSNCKTLPSGKNQVYFDSRDYAVSKGYKPCKNCDP